MVVRRGLDNYLKEIHLEVIEMASLVEYAIQEAIEALKHQDEVLAQKVISQDDQVDEKEKLIEEKCIKLIATQHPLAKDLRIIISVLKMLTDLERIADHAADICELMLGIAGEEHVKPSLDISRMAVIVRDMVRDAIDAYINNDARIAEQVSKKDAVVDEYFESIITDLQEMMTTKPEKIKQATVLIYIVKHIEKIGDHATNLCELVGYILTGKYKSLY